MPRAYYRPSKRISIGGFFAGILTACFLAPLLAGAIFLLDDSILYPLIVVPALGCGYLIRQVTVQTGCRNVDFAMLLGFVCGASGTILVHVFDAEHFRATQHEAFNDIARADGHGPLSDEEFVAVLAENKLARQQRGMSVDASYRYDGSFKGYLRLASAFTIHGVEVDPAHGIVSVGFEPRLGGPTASYVFWVLEILIVGLVVLYLAQGGLQHPFCEACKLRHIQTVLMDAVLGQSSMLKDSLRRRRLSEGIARLTPAFALPCMRLSLFSCSGCQDEDCYLLVERVWRSGGASHRSLTGARRSRDDRSEGNFGRFQGETLATSAGPLKRAAEHLLGSSAAKLAPGLSAALLFRCGLSADEVDEVEEAIAEACQMSEADGDAPDAGEDAEEILIDEVAPENGCADD